MKNTGTCPKCKGKSLIFIPGAAGVYGAGNNIMTGKTILSAVPVNRYVCQTCGYSEEWVDLENLPKLIKRYAKD